MILFINACVRKESRTKQLADYLIAKLNERVEEVRLEDILFPVSDEAFLQKRDELISQDRPAIVWWKYNHFCVFCGKDDKGDVVICNPDRGRYSLSVGTFKSFYSGVSITHGTPEVLPEEPSDQVTLTQSEYDDIMDVVAKAEEVFA